MATLAQSPQFQQLLGRKNSDGTVEVPAALFRSILERHRDRALSIPNAAQILRVAPGYLDKLIAAGELPSHKVRGEVRVRESDILTLIERVQRERDAILEEMVRINEELGLYDE